jgi:hypothetical protein
LDEAEEKYFEQASATRIHLEKPAKEELLEAKALYLELSPPTPTQSSALHLSQGHHNPSDMLLLSSLLQMSHCLPQTASNSFSSMTVI